MLPQGDTSLVEPLLNGGLETKLENEGQLSAQPSSSCLYSIS